MNTSDYQLQTGAALYPDALYNRPLSRVGRTSGQLVTIGGHLQSCASAAAWPGLAEAAGLGVCRLLLPDSLQKLIGYASGVDFLPSTPAGSIAQAALQEILQATADADGLAMGWDLSGNSDTTILLEHVIDKSDKPLALFGDGLVALRHRPKAIATSSSNCLILTQTEATKLAARLGIGIGPAQDTVVHKLELLHKLHIELPINLVLVGPHIVVMTTEGATVTPIPAVMAQEKMFMTAVMCAWWIRHAPKALSGLTCAAYIVKQTAAVLPAAATYTQSQLYQALDQALKQADDTIW